MPQLNPAPWFSAMLFTWLVFTAVVIPKTLAHIFPQTPKSQSSQTLETQPWSWPW